MCRNAKRSLGISQSVKPYDHMKVGSLHALHFSPGCEQLAGMKKIPSVAELVSDIVFQTCAGMMRFINNAACYICLF